MAEETQPENTAAGTSQQPAAAASTPAPFSAEDQRALQGMALHSMATALSLTLHNAVAEQQHGHILRMAMTTAATNALLQGRTAEAEAVLKLAESQLVSPDLSGILAQIKGYLDTLAKQIADMAVAPAPAHPSTDDPEASQVQPEPAAQQ